MKSEPTKTGRSLLDKVYEQGDYIVSEGPISSLLHADKFIYLVCDGRCEASPLISQDARTAVAA